MNTTLAIADEVQFHALDVEIQHRRILQLAQDLTVSLAAGKPADAVAEVLERLTGFLELHCADEEQFLEAHGYPDDLLNPHREQHLDILHRLRTAKELLTTQGLRSGMCGGELLREWLEDHVQNQDEVYLRYFRERAGI